MIDYADMTDEQRADLMAKMRAGMQWADAAMANVFLMNFTDPWPEEDAAALMQASREAKRRGRNNGRL